MSTNIFYIGQMDWGPGHSTIIVGTGGGAFANKNCSQGWAFDQFFQMPGVSREGCSRLKLTRNKSFTSFSSWDPLGGMG